MTLVGLGSIRRSLAAGPEAPGAARRAVEFLAGYVDDDLLDEHDIAFWLEGSDDVHGVLSLRAGDLLRFVGTTHVSGEPTSWRLDVALAFGGTRRAPAV